jgi:Protein of unknown function (DUF1353)
VNKGGFSAGARVVVEQLDDKNWVVREPFSYTGKQDPFEIYAGMRTDFASVPRIFAWLLPSYGRYTKAAIVHDLLWREWAKEGRLDYIDADGIFRRAMRELEVPFLRRWMMWAAVRWGALRKPGGRRKWLREAPRVLVMTLVAAPIVLPPALFIGLGMFLFLIFEVIAWLLLKLAETVRGILKRPSDKAIIAPMMGWRLEKPMPPSE